jgi:hypothetical protein
MHAPATKISWLLRSHFERLERGYFNPYCDDDFSQEFPQSLEDEAQIVAEN